MRGKVNVSLIARYWHRRLSRDRGSWTAMNVLKRNQDGMDAATLRKVLLILGKFDLVVLYGFGSRAKGKGRPGSDLDLAFLPGVACHGYDVFAASQEVADLVKCEVDLVDLSRASAVMRAQVVGTGRRLFVADDGKMQEFEMYALSDYARTNEERREVLIALGAIPA